MTQDTTGIQDSLGLVTTPLNLVSNLSVGSVSPLVEQPLGDITPDAVGYIQKYIEKYHYKDGINQPSGHSGLPGFSIYVRSAKRTDISFSYDG